MASPNIYSSGYGGNTGVGLSTRSPVYASGVAYYVSSITGSNSYAGTDRTKPFANLSNAYTAASANDTITMLENHSETIASAITLAKAGLRIRGEGSGSTRPRLTCGTSGTAMLNITAAGVWLQNIFFPASTVAAATARVIMAGAQGWLSDSYFECGATDTVPSLSIGAAVNRVSDTTFISTATSVTAQPTAAIKNSGAFADLTLENVTLDGGDAGWSTYAIDGSSGALTRLYAVDLSLLDDSDVFLASGSTGELHVKDRSGSARIVWTA